jgi:hypothetical protein
MNSDAAAISVSNGRLWTGRIFSSLAILFLLFDGVLKLFKPAVVTQAFAHLGVPETIIIPIGILLIVCTILYAIPLTSVLGAILLTGYLGGATAIHVRVGDPLVTHALFPSYMGILIWGGLYARDPRLHRLVPFRN